MKVLAIDTSSATATAAVLVDSVLVGEYTLNSGKTHSQKLLAMIEKVLSDCGIKPSEIDLYACASGPGSFTGLRIGAATIKGMAHAFNKPVLGVPTLDILAYNMCGYNGLICSVLDAQRDTLYSAIYSFDENKLIRLRDLKTIAAEELIKLLESEERQVLLLGDGVPLLRERVRDSRNIRIAPPIYQLPRAAACAALAAELYDKGELQAYDSFVPTYIRKSQAEDEYEKRLKLELADMTLEDVDAIHEIEVLSFKTPWTKEAFFEELTNNKLAKYIAAKVNGRPIGYGGMWFVLDEAHITNIAIHPDFRGHKLGEKIVQALIAKAVEHKITKMTLEVRTSNTVARSLYKKLGFIDYGIRKGYYYDTGEDAVIMWKEL